MKDDMKKMICEEAGKARHVEYKQAYLPGRVGVTGEKGVR